MRSALVLVVVVAGCSSAHPRAADAGSDAGSDAGDPVRGCSSDSTCAPDEVCLLERCTPIDETCAIDADCGPGRTCVDNACLPRCDATCPSWDICDVGYCSEEPEGAGEPCDADSDAGLYCRDGECRLDVRPVCPCLDDSSCRPGSRCGPCGCMAPCESDLDCTMMDPHRVCGDDDLCVITARTEAECRRRSDCPAGRSCVNGRCAGE